MWGYHCKALGRHVCHTMFGFRNGKLTSFSTDSALFKMASGVRPGMQPDDVRNREPGAVFDATCNTARLPARKGTSRVVYFSGPVFSLYASNGNAAFDSYC